MSSNQDTFSQDQVFDVLSSARRRYVIYYLRERNEAVALTELARQVAAWEYDTDPEDLTDQQEKRVYVSLYQTHVPKLAEFGIVEHDEDRGVVSLTDRSRALDAHLSPSEERAIPWQYVYLTLAVVGVLALLAAIQDVSVFAAVDGSVVGVVFALAFGATALVQLLYQRRAERHIPEEFRAKN
jgi:hypothetical protein